MITKEQYLEALSIVESYHEQLNLVIVEHCDNDNDISKLKKGDYIRFTKEVKPIPKSFTIGKKYKVLDVLSHKHWMTGEMYVHSLKIRNDKNLLYCIPVTNTFKRWSCV